MLAILLIISLLLCLEALRKHLNFFKDRNIPYLKSFPLLGIFDGFFFGRKSIFQCYFDACDVPDLKDEPFFGAFSLQKPMLLIKNQELINRIFLKDFHSFNGRSLKFHENDSFQTALPFTNSTNWKRIRSSLLPSFTATKLKSFFNEINEISKVFCTCIERKIEDGKNEINLKEISGQYTMDVTGKIFYGIDSQCLDGKPSELRDALNSIIVLTWRRFLDFFVIFFEPFLHKIVKAQFFGERYTKYIIKFTKNIFEKRKEEETPRGDYIDQLLELKNNGKFSEDEIMAQAAAFLFGSYESTSSLISNALYELSKNLTVQQKLRDEIRKYFQENEELTFEAVNSPSELPYLDKVVCETLRVHLIAPIIDRVCINPEGYSLEPFSSYKIPCGMTIVAPIYFFAQDGKYYKDPLTFNPERFDEKVTEGYYPFGIGYRSCIGERMGKVIAKIAIVNFLKEFRVARNENTPQKLTIKKGTIIMIYNEKTIVDVIKDPVM